MSSAFPPALRDALAAAGEIRIRTAGTGPKGVMIWAVAVDGVIYLRSYRGRTAKWFAGALADPHGEIDVGDTCVAVTLTPVTDPEVIAAVSRAYLAKYASSPFAAAMVAGDILDTTLLVSPA
jgi:hypothetical protein